MKKVVEDSDLGMSESDEDDQVDDDDIIIPVSMRHESVYDKSYACKFCETLVTKLSRHLANVHRNGCPQ